MRVLVLGGSGAVGSQVVAQLRDEGAELRYTGAGDLEVDFRSPGWVESLAGLAFDAVVHCAVSVSHPWPVNYRALVDAVAAVEPEVVVALTALYPGQSLALPVEFAASWGAVNAWVGAEAKRRAPGVVVGVAVGPLTAGLSEGLDGQLLRDFERLSALRRRGDPAEVARAVTWLVTRNRWLTGQIIPINGGI